MVEWWDRRESGLAGITRDEAGQRWRETRPGSTDPYFGRSARHRWVKGDGKWGLLKAVEMGAYGNLQSRATPWLLGRLDMYNALIVLDMIEMESKIQVDWLIVLMMVKSQFHPDDLGPSL